MSEAITDEMVEAAWKACPVGRFDREVVRRMLSAAMREAPRQDVFTRSQMNTEVQRRLDNALLAHSILHASPSFGEMEARVQSLEKALEAVRRFVAENDKEMILGCVDMIPAVYDLMQAIYETAGVAAANDPIDPPIAWESTTPCYIKFITDERYRSFSPEARRWYKPYRCSSCSEKDPAHDNG